MLIASRQLVGSPLLMPDCRLDVKRQYWRAESLCKNPVKYLVSQWALYCQALKMDILHRRTILA
jgi:hypothetical protein